MVMVFAVRHVVEMVKRVSGVDFKVEIERACTTLRWQPQYADLATIVAHAIAWEHISENACWRTQSQSELTLYGYRAVFAQSNEVLKCLFFLALFCQKAISRNIILAHEQRQIFAAIFVHGRARWRIRPRRRRALGRSAEPNRPSEDC
jgi:hypothetical protein